MVVLVCEAGRDRDADHRAADPDQEAAAAEAVERRVKAEKGSASVIRYAFRRWVVSQDLAS